MTRTVALLRGINVGPTTKVPMAVLRSLFLASGATDVVTLLNSGNVVFSGTVDARAIESRIREQTGVTTRVLIVPADRFRRITEAFPFDVSLNPDESKLTVAFMSSVPTDVDVPPELAPEIIAFGAEAVYQSLPDGISKTKLKPSFWKQLPPETTVRNLRTVKKLLALLDDPA